MGIAGFVLGLLSVVLCCFPYLGLIGVPGLILSVIGLFHPKKGLAIAGTILSTIGSILAILYLILIASIPAAIGGLGFFDMIKGAAIAGGVTETATASGGTLPADLTPVGLPPSLTTDKWGTTFIYTPRGDGTFTLASAGPDKTPGTSDDIDIGAALLQSPSTSSDFPALRSLTAPPETPQQPLSPGATEEPKKDEGSNPVDSGKP